METGKTKKFTTIAMLVASAAVLQLIESPLPRFFPWLKPGLANVLTLYAIIKYSFKAGIFTAAARSILAAVIIGSFLSPVFYLSFAGAVSAAFVMGIMRKFCKNLEIISISGALTNNYAQLALVQILFAENTSLWLYIAVMIWVSIPSGFVIAKITKELLRRTKNAS